MNYLLLLILLLTTPCIAQEQQARMSIGVMGGAVAGASCTSVTVDLWETLEAVPGSGLWTKVDASSKLSASSSGEVATIKCPGGVADTGTNGVTWAGAAASQSYYTFASAKTTFSLGLWFKSGTYANYTTYNFIVEICQTANCASGFVHTIADGKIGDVTHKIGRIGGEYINVSDATWYWLTVKFDRNATSSFALYDTTGSQVGSTQTFTGFDATAESVSLFPRTYDTTSSAIYWDDLIVDWTDSTFPLGP